MYLSNCIVLLCVCLPAIDAIQAIAIPAVTYGTDTAKTGQWLVNFVGSVQQMNNFGISNKLVTPAVTSCGGRLFVSGGGLNTIDYSTDISVYDAMMGELMPFANMTLGRRHHTMNCVHDQALYICGGNSAPGVVEATCEICNLQSQTCEFLRWNMPLQIKYHGAMATNHHLFIVGGINGVDDLSNVFVYDFGLHSWSNLPNMLNVREGYPGVALVNNTLLVCGGYDTDYLASCESYDFEEKVWTKRASMKTARAFHGFVKSATEEAVYAIGGYNGVELDSVEMYDCAMDMWHKAETQLMAPNANAWVACSF